MDVVLRDREGGLLDVDFLADPPSEVVPAFRKGAFMEPVSIERLPFFDIRNGDMRRMNETYHSLRFASTKPAAAFLWCRYFGRQCPG